MIQEECDNESVAIPRVKDNYIVLKRILAMAESQASRGKGIERHGSDDPFESQSSMVIARLLKGHTAGGPLFQSMKKIVESGRLDKTAAIKELRGAIIYAAMAIKILEEEK